MQVRDIMTTEVVSVSPETGLREVLEILLKRRISGVPVLDTGKVVGFVDEGDLLHRYEIGTDEPTDAQAWWHRLIGLDTAPLAYVRSHGLHARDVMDTAVVAVTEDTPLADVATIFKNRRIRRVVVKRGWLMVGLVTRADLLRALVKARASAPQATEPISDEAIRAQLIAELRRHSWWTNDPADVAVRHGRVRFTGRVRNEADRQAACIAAANTPGVRGVDDERAAAPELPVTI